MLDTDKKMSDKKMKRRELQPPHISVAHLFVDPKTQLKWKWKWKSPTVDTRIFPAVTVIANVPQPNGRVGCSPIRRRRTQYDSGIDSPDGSSLPLSWITCYVD